MTRSKILLLKLGGKCNLRCPHCHCMDISFEFNEDIFAYIEKNDIKRITFSGGEPLLYYDVMKKVMERCGQSYEYKFVTNGTLVTDEMVDFFNGYNTYVCVSYDGENGGRDACDPRYRKIGRIKNNGLAVTVYNANMDFKRLSRDIMGLQIKNDLNYWEPGTFFPNFVHQTRLSPNAEITKETAQAYIVQFAHRLEIECMAFRNGVKLNRLALLSGVLRRWFVRREYQQGVRCCNPHIENLTLAGDFLLCPYSDTVVGNIYDGIDYALVDSYKPERCKACALWDICKNPCVANITDHECYIFKTLYRHFKKLLKKYDLSEEALQANFQENGELAK